MLKGRDLKYFTLGAIIVASGLSVWAAVSIPNTFVAGTTIKAADVNANFSSLKAFVDALETNKQNRVSATCAVGSSIRVIAADGTVTCQADNGGPGGVTYVAGTGLTLAGSEFSVNTAVIQSRVTGTCAAGSSISAIAANGTVTCGSGNLSAPVSISGDSTTPVLTVTNTRASGVALEVDGPIKVGGSSKAAFKYTVNKSVGGTVCGSGNNYSVIDNATINGDANALVFLTATETAPTGVAVRYNPVGVSGCDPNKWFVYLPSGSFSGNETYNVLIVKQ